MKFTYVPPDSPEIKQARSMLHAGRVNPKDRWLAQVLTGDPTHVMESGLTWLRALIRRDGEPYLAKP